MPFLTVLLILAVAGGVFAQDITWSGEVKTGAMINIGDKTGVTGGEYQNWEGDKAAVIKADEDDVPTGLKARLNAEVTGESWGIQFGTMADIAGDDADDLGPSKIVSFYNAHGWLDFVNGMIKVRAGLIDPKAWSTKGPKDWAVSQGLGFRLEVMPIEGLNVGAFLNYDEAGSGATGTMGVADWFQETAFGFSYENADIMGLYANAAFKLDSEFANGNSDNSVLTFGFGLTPMEALSVKVEGRIANLGAYSDIGWMWFVEDVSYQVMEPLKAGLEMRQQIASEDSQLANLDLATLIGPNPENWEPTADFEGYQMYLRFRPYAEYAVNESILIGADVPVDIADNGDDTGLESIGAGIWAKYTVGGGWIQAGYSFENRFEDYVVSGESALGHTIRLIAGFAF